MQWSLASVIVLAAVYGLFELATRSRPGQAFPDQGQQHIAIGERHLPYNSNPPTSGPHYLQPAAWGIYQSELPDETLVHNLEHGGIWISYNNIDRATKQKLESLARQYPVKLIIGPRAKDDAPIVLASWGRMLKLQSFDEDAIVSFIRANKNKAPEPNAM